MVEVLEANLGAVNYHKVVEEATPEDTEQGAEPMMKRSQRMGERKIAEKEHRGEEFGRRREEDLR